MRSDLDTSQKEAATKAILKDVTIAAEKMTMRAPPPAISAAVADVGAAAEIDDAEDVLFGAFSAPVVPAVPTSTPDAAAELLAALDRARRMLDCGSVT